MQTNRRQKLILTARLTITWPVEEMLVQMMLIVYCSYCLICKEQWNTTQELVGGLVKHH